MKIRPDSKLLIGTTVTIALTALAIWSLVTWISAQKEMQKEMQELANRAALPFDILLDETATQLARLEQVNSLPELFELGGRPGRMAGYNPEIVLGIYTPSGRRHLSSAALFDQPSPALKKAFDEAQQSQQDSLCLLTAWNGAAYIGVVRPRITQDGELERFNVYSFALEKMQDWGEALDIKDNISLRLLTSKGSTLMQLGPPPLTDPVIGVSRILGNFELRLSLTADKRAVLSHWVRHKLSGLLPVALVIVIASGVIFFMVKLYNREFRHQEEATALRQVHMAQREQDRQRLVDAVNSLSEGFALWDVDDKLVLGNTPLHFYFPREVVGDPLGQTFETLYSKIIASGFIPAARDKPQQWLHERLKQHLKPSGSYEIRLSNGRWVRITERKTREGGIAATYTDITLEKVAAERIRKEKETAETYLAIAGTIILALDSWGRVTLINRKGREILGRPESDIIGRTWWDLALPQKDRSKFTEMYTQAMRQESALPEYFENEIVTLDGSRRLIAWHNAVIPDREGRTAGSLSSGEDITHRKQTELALRHAMQAAELANRAKTEFLATMSHELRTPLNSIIGFSDILANEMFGPLGQPDYQQYSKDINESGKHLLDLINDILDIARIESGGMVLREAGIDVGRLMQSTIRMVHERAEHAGLILELVDALPKPTPMLFGDERRLKQVLINLLYNAIKFTPSGGTVTLVAGMDRESRFYFQVTDTGIGIAQKDLERVLSPFGQADGSFSRPYEGAGLGLPLSNNLVELHQGTLLLDSAPGEGTTVTVRLPANRTTFLKTDDG
ncbi:hypothetical protein JCM17960_25020 [Magnetospira thiophila]